MGKKGTRQEDMDSDYRFANHLQRLAFLRRNPAPGPCFLSLNPKTENGLFAGRPDFDHEEYR
jgi:hypothetical protein